MPTIKYPSTPTLDRVKEITPYSQKIGEFLEWLQHERKICLATYHEHTDDQLLPAHASISTLLHEFFEIDPGKEETERRAVLDYVRKLNS